MTAKSKIALTELLPILGLVEEFSAKKVELNGIGEVGSALPGQICFVSSESYLKNLSQTQASVAVVRAQLALPESLPSNLIVLKSRDPMLAFARTSEKFYTAQLANSSIAIHPSAQISKTAQIGQGVCIGPGVVIGDHVQIGDQVRIDPGVVIGEHCQIGSMSHLYPHVVLYNQTEIGQKVVIHANTVIGADGFGYVPERTSQGVRHTKIYHSGRVQIGDEVEIGANSSIDRGTISNTIIERGCKIDNNVQIGHNCHLEEGVIICGSTGLAGSVHVGKFAVVAGFVGVANGSDIGAGATIAGYTMVFGKIPPGVKWGGVPGRPLREFLKLEALVARLPELFAAYKLDRKHKEKNI